MPGGIKQWPEDERPREKLLKRGPEALTDAELSKEMKAAVQKIWDEKDPEKKKELVKEFQ